LNVICQKRPHCLPSFGVGGQVIGMAESPPVDRPLTLRDALAVLEALRVEAQMHGRPHAHLMVAIAALQPPTADEGPLELADFAEAELAKAIEDAEVALARVETLRQQAREFRAATEALRAADLRKATSVPALLPAE
jgi:hypothetical protein